MHHIDLQPIPPTTATRPIAMAIQMCKVNLQYEGESVKVCSHYSSSEASE